jgi:hypothetical protein
VSVPAEVVEAEPVATPEPAAEPEAAPVENSDSKRVSNLHLTLAHFLDGYAVHGHIQSGVDDLGTLWVQLGTDDRGVTPEVLQLHALLEDRSARMLRNAWGSVDIRWDGVYDGHPITLVTYARDDAAAQLAAVFRGVKSDFLEVELDDLEGYIRDGEGE